MKQSTITRLEKLEKDRPAKKIAVPLYACVIDGKEMELSPVEYARKILQGYNGSFGGQCGIRYEEWEPDSRPRSNELQAAFAELQEKYNSQEEQRKEDKHGTVSIQGS